MTLLLFFQLLDACVKNSGRLFHLEVASREFEQEFRKLLPKSHPRVAEKMKELLQKWVEGEFKSDPQLSLIPSFYQRLRSENVDFTPRDPKVSFYIFVLLQMKLSRILKGILNFSPGQQQSAKTPMLLLVRKKRMT